MSRREIQRRYEKLMHDVATKDYYTKVDLTNRVNCYVCTSCDHITKTKDSDAGVTPMFYRCENCGGIGRSSFYNDIAPNQRPTKEWYRPSLKEALKLKSYELDHVLGGGLLIRKISQ